MAIISDVPPKPAEAPVRALTSVGMDATIARNMALTMVSLPAIFVMYSTVGLPGRMPGTNPPLFFRLSAISVGLRLICP